LLISRIPTCFPSLSTVRTALALICPLILTRGRLPLPELLNFNLLFLAPFADVMFRYN
jgi:hypothetical protein